MICDLCNEPIHCELKGIIKYGHVYLHRDCIVPKDKQEKQLDRIERMLRWLVIQKELKMYYEDKFVDAGKVGDTKEFEFYIKKREEVENQLPDISDIIEEKE